MTALVTATDLLFIGLPDGNFIAMDAVSGKELWRFQTGASISSGAATYTIGGEQYVAMFSAGTGIPYGNSITEGDMLWAFKLGGSYKTASGSSELPMESVSFSLDSITLQFNAQDERGVTTPGTPQTISCQ